MIANLAESLAAWLERHDPSPKCPGCGCVLVEWTSERISSGCREEMFWTGCPSYRDSKSFSEKDRHTAYWRRGKRTPLIDEIRRENKE